MDSLLGGTITVPAGLVWAFALFALMLVAWTYSLVHDRNPLPFPDKHYHVFSASSSAGLGALEEVMQAFGHKPRFRVDTEIVERTIFANGTIVNHPVKELSTRLGSTGGALGFVVRDPDAAAEDAARRLRTHGFSAEVLRGVEPGLPIVFVTTNALSSAVLVFRKHVLHMGKKPAAWTPRRRATAATGAR